MSTDVRSLQPTTLWNHFADLNAVPRPSKKEERVRQFILGFGRSLNLETIEDETGNILIKKPASPGMEDRETVLMQSHIDMVHQKNADTRFDFDTQGIEMYVDGDWVKAKGTTLGADNGIGVASIMALLSSTDIKHPAIEALFTVDEETGMTGALGLKPGFLSARIMLNLDTEDDRELTIGCAGGVDVMISGKYEQEPVPAGSKNYRITVKGLTGGHSRMDIHKGRGNANKIMNRLLFQLEEKLGARVAEIDGGSLRNAIPRESVAVISVPESNAGTLRYFIDQETQHLKAEHATTDANLSIELVETQTPASVLSAHFQHKLLRVLYACPNGIYRMSPDIAGLVQTSNNLARVQVKDGHYGVQCLTRSSVDTEKEDLARAIKGVFELINAEVNFKGQYPGWAPKPGSGIVRLMSNLYRELYHDEPHVNACHAA